MQADNQADALVNLVIDSPKVTGKYLFHLILEGSIISLCSLLYCLRTWLSSPFLSIVFTCPFFAVLYVWLSLVMLSQLVQFPLRLMILNRLRLAHKGQPDRGELVRRLINVLQSRLWEINQSVGKNNLSLLVVGTFLICFRGDQTKNYRFEDTLGIEAFLASVFRLHPQYIELLLRSPPMPEQMAAIFSCSVAALTALFLRFASSFALFVLMFRERGVPMDAEQGPAGEKQPCSKFLEDKLKYWKWGENKTREKRKKLLEQKQKLQAAIELASEELKSKIKPVIDPVMRPLDRLQTTIKDSFHFATTTASLSMAAIAEQHHSHLHQRLQRESQSMSASCAPDPTAYKPITDPFEDFGFGPATPAVDTPNWTENSPGEEAFVPVKKAPDETEAGGSLHLVNLKVALPHGALHANALPSESALAKGKSAVTTEVDVAMTTTNPESTFVKPGLQTTCVKQNLKVGTMEPPFAEAESKVEDGTSIPVPGSGTVTPHTPGNAGDAAAKDQVLCCEHMPLPIAPESDDLGEQLGPGSSNDQPDTSVDHAADLPEDELARNVDGVGSLAELPSTELTMPLDCVLSSCATPSCEEYEADREEEEEEEEEEDCPICLGPFEIGETVACLPCNSQHFFHASCIHPWLLQDKRCPLCATDIDWKD